MKNHSCSCLLIYKCRPILEQYISILNNVFNVQALFFLYYKWKSFFPTENNNAYISCMFVWTSPCGLRWGAAAPPAGGLCDLSCFLSLCFGRFCKHQRQEHAGKEGQRGGGDRGGLGDGAVGYGRAGVPGGKIRPAAAARVLQVLKTSWILLFKCLYSCFH